MGFIYWNSLQYFDEKTLGKWKKKWKKGKHFKHRIVVYLMWWKIWWILWSTFVHIYMELTISIWACATVIEPFRKWIQSTERHTQRMHIVNTNALTSKLLEKRIAIVKINILNRKEGTWKQFVFVRQNNWNKLLATKILVDPLKKFNI